VWSVKNGYLRLLQKTSKTGTGLFDQAQNPGSGDGSINMYLLFILESAS
jgi:hypothetical protein